MKYNYRRCLRITYHLFECSTINLHTKFLLPTLEEKFQKSLMKWLNNIEQYEQEIVACYLMNKTIFNTTHYHYTEKSCVQFLSRGRPSTHLNKFYQTSPTFFDKLVQFVNLSIVFYHLDAQAPYGCRMFTNWEDECEETCCLAIKALIERPWSIFFSSDSVSVLRHSSSFYSKSLLAHTCQQREKE
jgi:hypothetical protein